MQSDGTITYIHNLLITKKISCYELTQKYLYEIKKSKLNAYVNVCEESAIKSAKEIDKKIAAGKEISLLEGIPMLLKDNMSTNGIETTCCSNILKGYVPIYDATVWELLKQQGAVLLGKGNMDEFAMGSTCETSCFGGAKNPHDISCVAGGSSGGVAAAVSGNIAVYGLGSDTGGSIRQPAAFCGIVGLKPTYGAVSRYGIIAYASSFDQVGPMTHTVQDASIVFDAISKYDPKDSTSCKNITCDTFCKLNNSISGMKIGIPKEYFEGVDSEIQKSIDQAIEVYKSLGAQIEYFNLPELKYALPVYYILVCAEASSNLGRYDGIRYGYKAENYTDINDMICKTRAKGFGKEVKRRILLGTYVLSAGYYDAYYKKAQNLRGEIVRAFKRAFGKFDILLAPTAASTAFKFGMTSSNPVEMYLTDIYTVPVNTAGIPAISLPCGFHSNGLPIGMQLIGDNFSEAKLLNAANMYEMKTERQFLHKTDMGVKI